MKNSFMTGILAALVTVMAGAGIAGCDNAERFLRAEPASFDIASDVLSVSTDIEASASWMAYCNASWLSYDYDGNTLLVGITAINESTEDRFAEIHITTGDGQSRIIPLVQRAMNAILDVDPAVFAEFDSRGATSRTVTVSSNLSEWSFTNREQWLKIVRGEDENANVLTVTAERSYDLSERRDSLIVYPMNELFYPIADTIPVVQAGALLAIRSTMQNANTHALEVPATGAEVAVSIYAKYDWTVATDDSEERLSLDIAGGSANTESGTILTITVPENTLPESVTYTITFTCGGEEYEYELVQSADEPEPLPET